MVSSRKLLSTVESSLLSASLPSASQRIELMHALRSSSSSLRTLLSYPPPRGSDRAQVQSGKVQLPDSSTLPLDDQDIQVALKLSDDLHLNEIDCVRLLIVTNQEWGLMGRDPLEILRLAAGFWYTERRDFLTVIYTLLRALVLDQDLEADFVTDIHQYVEGLFQSGLRERFITLIKELNRDEPSGLGGPHCESYVIDSKSAVVARKTIVTRERLVLAHCLVLSVLVMRPDPKHFRDVFHSLKECAGEMSLSSNSTSKCQITYSLFFCLAIALISDALGALNDEPSVLASDSSFKQEFHDTVMKAEDDSIVEGFMSGLRLAWIVYLMSVQDTSKDSFRGTHSCLEAVFSSNAFRFLLEKMLQSAAFKNDDEDMVYIYYGYLHKMVSCFLSHPTIRDRLKEAKERAMIFLGAASHDSTRRITPADRGLKSETFISLLEFVSEIYASEPELSSGDDALWSFAYFAGEDHTNFETLVAFLKFLGAMALTGDGASRVFDLLQSKRFRSIGWSTLYDCLSIYDEKFGKFLPGNAASLPEFQEGDARVLVAYLDLLQKVLKNAAPDEARNWFPDVEPLFKLLRYENVPPYLKGALRNSIAAFVELSPELKDTVWLHLERYDLPIIGQPSETEVYDMHFELNEIETRSEKYPSTLSFIRLLNALISGETDGSDRGVRFIGIFRFITHHVFERFHQRGFVDPCEKWQLAVACLQHFHMILTKYELRPEDADYVIEIPRVPDPAKPPPPPPPSSSSSSSSSLDLQIPLLELLKDFMSGKTVFRNIMTIILPGVNVLLNKRSTEIYGWHMEEAVKLSLEIVWLVFEKDGVLSDFWRPMYQPLDAVISRDVPQVVALLEYVRYDFHPRIQHWSIKLMSAVSGRMPELVQLLSRSNAADLLIEDYASCFESRVKESRVDGEDVGILILQLLIDNVGRPSPNVSHLLLKFDVDLGVETTVLQPNLHYSCLKIILGMLDKYRQEEDSSAGLLYELSLELLHDLCVDAVTRGPTIDLLCSRKYRFFVRHLDSIASPPNGISSLHQRAWLLKLLAVAVFSGDASDCAEHRETRRTIGIQMFGSRRIPDAEAGIETDAVLGDCRALELLLEILESMNSDTDSNESHGKSVMERVLSDPDKPAGIFAYSDRGDRLIDLASLRDSLIHSGEEKESVDSVLRSAWKHNRTLEERAARLHILTGWFHVVEVLLLETRERSSDAPSLFRLLDTCLSACASPCCSLRTASVLCDVALTCMARLRDERSADGARRSLLPKLVTAMTRRETSEPFRTRQYALLLTYFRLDVPDSVLHRDDVPDDRHADDAVSATAFAVLKREARRFLNPVIEDATRGGSDAGKALSLHVLDALISIDRDGFFLDQLQRRGFLTTCFANLNDRFIGSNGLCVLEAELALLLRISHAYGKSGARLLFSLGAIGHLKAIDLQATRPRVAVPLLRLLCSLTRLLDAPQPSGNAVVNEAVDFIRSHRAVFARVLRRGGEAEAADEEEIDLVVGILTRAWPYDDECELVRGLFGITRALLSRDGNPVSPGRSNAELCRYRITLRLSSYVHFLVRHKSFRLKVTGDACPGSPPTVRLLGRFLGSVAVDLERAVEERCLLLSKIHEINELSGQEVDDVISMCGGGHRPSSLSRRRCRAMAGACDAAANVETMVSIGVSVAEQLMHTLLLHFQAGDGDAGRDGDVDVYESVLSGVKRLAAVVDEGKVGVNKMFPRLANSLRETVLQKLGLL